jgi:hypothetical protein
MAERPTAKDGWMTLVVVLVFLGLLLACCRLQPPTVDPAVRAAQIPNAWKAWGDALRDPIISLVIGTVASALVGALTGLWFAAQSNREFEHLEDVIRTVSRWDKEGSLKIMRDPQTDEITSISGGGSVVIMPPLLRAQGHVGPASVNPDEPT